MNFDLIKEAMSEKEMTVRQLESVSGVPKTTLERILNGSTQNPGIQTMADIAVALGLSLNDIAGIEYEGDSAPNKVQVVHHTHSAEVNMLYRSMISERDSRIKKLTIAVTVLVLYQMFRWMLDVSNPQLGWIRLDDANVRYVSVFLIVAFVLIGVAAILYFALRYKNAHAHHHKE